MERKSQELRKEVLHSEWFWSEKSANKSAERLRSLGYIVTVSHERDADGRMDWMLRAY